MMVGGVPSGVSTVAAVTLRRVLEVVSLLLKMVLPGPAPLRDTPALSICKVVRPRSTCPAATTTVSPGFAPVSAACMAAGSVVPTGISTPAELEGSSSRRAVTTNATDGSQ